MDVLDLYWKGSIKIGGEKLGVLTKQRREGQFSGEYEQGGLHKSYKAHLINFIEEIVSKRVVNFKL